MEQSKTRHAEAVITGGKQMDQRAEITASPRTEWMKRTPLESQAPGTPEAPPVPCGHANPDRDNTHPPFHCPSIPITPAGTQHPTFLLPIIQNQTLFPHARPQREPPIKTNIFVGEEIVIP